VPFLPPALVTDSTRTTLSRWRHGSNPVGDVNRASRRAARLDDNADGLVLACLSDGGDAAHNSSVSLRTEERFRWSAHRSSRSSCKAGALPTELRPGVYLTNTEASSSTPILQLIGSTALLQHEAGIQGEDTSLPQDMACVHLPKTSRGVIMHNTTRRRIRSRGCAGSLAQPADLVCDDWACEPFQVETADGRCLYSLLCGGEDSLTNERLPGGRLRAEP
jgi:hypothetical protein